MRTQTQKQTVTKPQNLIIPKETIKTQTNFNLTELDSLCIKINNLKEQEKTAEKELITLLKKNPNNTYLGKLYGAYYTHTKSTTISYKTVLDELIKKMTEVAKRSPLVQNLIVHVFSVIEEQQKPHKSSSESLVIFTLTEKDKKLGNIYK